MKKRNIILIVIIIVLVALALLVLYSENDKKDEKIPLETKEETKSETLKNLLQTSNYFKDSKIIVDSEKQIVKIDDLYDISIKSGYYMMTIKDTKLEEGYCNIVDAVETSLGLEEGSSIETCKKTLDGVINIGGITAEIYDDYKVLSVNSEEKAILYDVKREHKEKELISIDEINYNIDIENYLFTSMTTAFTEASKEYSVCGHIYNQKNKDKEFLFKIYDTDKNILNEQKFTYKNDTKKYISFCVDFPSDKDNIKYYSVEEAK